MSTASAIEAKLEAESKAFQLLQKGFFSLFFDSYSMESNHHHFINRAFPSYRKQTTFGVSTTRE
jgi:hypothetical protein